MTLRPATPSGPFACKPRRYAVLGPPSCGCPCRPRRKSVRRRAIGIGVKRDAEIADGHVHERYEQDRAVTAVEYTNLAEHRRAADGAQVGLLSVTKRVRARLLCRRRRFQPVGTEMDGRARTDAKRHEDRDDDPLDARR